MTFAYSRGRSIHDSRPNTRTAPDFAAFVEAIARERAPSKVGAPYIAGPFNGDGRRCAEGALPRRWIALDFDRIDAETLPELRMWLARFKGVAWPTHSSTPDAPRERVILELARDASRDECLAIGEALSGDLAAEFGDGIALDASTFRPEQPIFVPPAGATLARFEGEPLDVDAYLAAAKKGRADAPERPRSSDRPEAGATIRAGGRNSALTRLGGSLRRAGLSATEIEAALLAANRERCEPPLPDDEVRTVARSVGRYEPGEADAQPLDIFRAIVAPELDPSDFPAVLADFAVPLARAAGHDPGAYLMAGLGSAAAAASDEVRLMLDSRTSWFTSARLWIVLIGAPGTAKTWAIRAAMGPLFDLHRQLRAQYAAQVAGVGPDEPKPPLPAVFVNDATIEKLSEILADNPRGLVAVYEELDSWLGSHDAYRGDKGSKDRGEWLRLFDGGPHQVDRIKRGSFFVPNWGCSILGATTFDGLRRHAKDLPTDGLIQRFLPVIVRRVTTVDEHVIGATIKRAREQFEGRLLDVFNMPPCVVKLSREAAEVFFALRAEINKTTDDIESFSPPLAGHFAKHAALLSRIALAFHCLEHGTNAAGVDLAGDTMQRADRLLRKLLRHALAMFDMLSGSDSVGALAQAVGRSIVAGELAKVTRRDLRQHCRAFKSATEHQREAAIRYLVDAAWLTPLTDGRQYEGRPAQLVVAPQVFERFRDAGEELKERRARVRELFER